MSQPPPTPPEAREPTGMEIAEQHQRERQAARKARAFPAGIRLAMVVQFTAGIGVCTIAFLAWSDPSHDPMQALQYRSGIGAGLYVLLLGTALMLRQTGLLRATAALIAAAMIWSLYLLVRNQQSGAFSLRDLLIQGALTVLIYAWLASSNLRLARRWDQAKAAATVDQAYEAADAD